VKKLESKVHREDVKTNYTDYTYKVKNV